MHGAATTLRVPDRRYRHMAAREPPGAPILACETPIRR